MGDSKPGRAAVGPWAPPAKEELIGSTEAWTSFTKQYDGKWFASRLTCYKRKEAGIPEAIRQWDAWKLYVAVLRIKGEL